MSGGIITVVLEMVECPDCRGSGEGRHEGAWCRTCRGEGEYLAEVEVEEEADDEEDDDASRAVGS